MVEEKKDKYDEGEYDQEGDMAKSDLRSIMANAKELHDMIDDADNLPEWCQNKITLAEDYISTVANYLTAEMNEGAIPAKEKTVTVRHKTSGKELVVTAEKAKQLKQQDYHPIKEAIKDKFDIGEYDQEGDMAKSDLRSIMANAKRVHDMLEDNDNLPEWVQSKITKAEDYMSTVANYMTSEMSEETDAIGLVKPKTGLTAAAKTLAPQTRVAEASKPPFDKPYTTIKGTITDKSGAKHTPMSRARDIARMAMKKQMEKIKQPVKESLDESRRMEIVREAMKVAKKKKETIVSDDKYQPDPMLSSQITKT